MEATTPTALCGMRIIELLQWGERLQGHEIATALGIDRRSVRRHISQLKAAGYEVKSSRGSYGSYWLGQGNTIAPLRFDDPEARTVLLALSTLLAALDRNDPLWEETLELLESMRAVLPEAVVAEAREQEREVTRRIKKMSAVYGVWERAEGRR